VSLPSVQSIRCARRVAPDGGLIFDLVAEVIQSGTVRRRGELFDFQGGCTLVIDPEGRIRYAIYKRLGSADRLERQIAAMRGPLKKFWTKRGKRHVPRPGLLRALHAPHAAARR
jgi:hypothetical protein